MIREERAADGKMSASAVRGKRAAIRRDIKERMQRELDKRKKEIKRRIKEEQIPVQEKRRRYRNEVKQEKLLLMSLAKEEFQARKRMLGLPTREEEGRSPEPPLIPAEAEQDSGSEPSLKDEAALQHFPNPSKSRETFNYEDKENSDVKELATPIKASDAMPLGMAAEDFDAGIRVPAKETPFQEEAEHTLLYYILNLVIHPIQTMDEFDDYLQSPFGIAKVILFYLVSLLPIALFLVTGEEMISRMPQGTLSSSLAGNAGSGGGFMAAITSPIVNLFFYSLMIAVVNYFVTDDANFLTLATYFAFIEAVTRIFIYSFIVLAVLSPQIVVLVPLLFLALLIWGVCLNIIVLMTAYGYDWLTAIIVSLLVLVAREFFVKLVVLRFLREQIF